MTTKRGPTNGANGMHRANGERAFAAEAPFPSGPYRIAVVAEMTGVPEPTLRAWERRYGIPTPDRTASGYRLYGHREVEQVREMRALCDGGMSAAEAAGIVRARPGQAPFAAPPEEPGADAFDGAVASILDAVERFDDDALETRIRQIMFLGNTTTLLDQVVAPVLAEVGRRWHAGDLSIAQEHFASQRLGTMMRDLLRLTPGADAARRVVLGSFADDDHELGLLGLALRLSTWGLRPVLLGARTPPGAVRDAVSSTSPDLVGLSVTLTPPPPRARELVHDYASACARVPWIVGGSGVGPLATLITAAGGIVDPGDPEELRKIVRATVERRHYTGNGARAR